MSKAVGVSIVGVSVVAVANTISFRSLPCLLTPGKGIRQVRNHLVFVHYNLGLLELVELPSWTSYGACRTGKTHRPPPHSKARGKEKR